jgi:hypothetical protein
MRVEDLLKIVWEYAPRTIVDETDEGEIILALGMKLADDSATLVDLDFDEDLGEDG